MKKIEPTILKGTRDFTPSEMARRNFVMAKIQGIFEKYGYAALETPILSPAETILGKYGEEGDRLTYHFKDQGDREVALPYDLTVPFARYAAANWRDLPMPFKRYQIQRVWRAEKPQKGRLREFYQCDIDVIGTKSLLVEAEVAKVIVEVFTVLGIPDFKIKISSRNLMNQIMERQGYQNPIDVIRVIDKADKIGKEGVLVELKSIDASKAAGTASIIFGELKDIKIVNPNNAVLDYLEQNGFDVSDIKTFLDYAKDLGIERYLEVDRSLARGLDYYTGLIFEVVSAKVDFGTLCAGGRYDNLTALFEVNASEGVETSGMGVAFGFERMMLVLEELGLLTEVRTAAEVLVTQLSGQEAASRKLYGELVDAGVSAEIYFEPAKLDKQLKFADKKGIAKVLIMGEEEAREGMVAVKDMATGEQKRVARQNIVKTFLP